MRALEIYELDRLDFAEAYLVALAEATGIGEIVSFDRSIDLVATVNRREPKSGTRQMLRMRADRQAA